MSTLRQRPVIAAFAAAFALFLSGCATKKHVRTQIDPLNQRVGKLESDLDANAKKANSAISELERGVSRADERAQGADGRATQALADAASSKEAAGRSSQEAAAASQAASSARSAADKGLAQSLARSGEIEQKLAAIDNLKLVSQEAVLFATAQTRLTDEAKQKLDAAASRITPLKRYVVEIQGFTDKTGSAALNLELSRKRAEEVVRYFTLQHKIPLHRIFVAGLGNASPVADEKTREGRRQNRRVEVKVYAAQ